MTTATSALSFALVTIISVTAPISITLLRRNWLTEVDTAARTCVVSVFSRDINSPECVRS